MPAETLRAAAQGVLDELGAPSDDPQRAVFCSRTLNLRSIKAIGESREGAF